MGIRLTNKFDMCLKGFILKSAESSSMKISWEKFFWWVVAEKLFRKTRYIISVLIEVWNKQCTIHFCVCWHIDACYNCQGCWDLTQEKKKIATTTQITYPSLSFSSTFVLVLTNKWNYRSKKGRTAFFPPKTNRYSNLILSEYDRIDDNHSWSRCYEKMSVVPMSTEIAE